jgi:WhiB family redox-sensing transcriptional regulator
MIELLESRGARADIVEGNWRNAAACLINDPELFFPLDNSGPARLQAEQAKAVCRRCPVTDKCLEWALESKEGFGVWGGLTADERRALSRRMARPSRAK